VRAVNVSSLMTAQLTLQRAVSCPLHARFATSFQSSTVCALTAPARCLDRVAFSENKSDIDTFV